MKISVSSIFVNIDITLSVCFFCVTISALSIILKSDDML